jgi:thioredoxin reductase (NADPH)
VIVGAGPAGLTAALYAARYKLKTVVLSKNLGGTIAESYKVENWPSIKSISGMGLIEKMKEQVTDLGVQIMLEEVIDIDKKKSFLVKTASSEYEAKSIILALGTQRRKLNIPGEKEFSGKGVSYCATCDAIFFKDKVVGVVGGSNAAAESAELLSEFAKKVYIIYRKEKIRAEPIITERVENNPKIEIITRTNVKEIKGDKFISRVIFDNGKEIELQGLFIEIGSDPCTRLPKKMGVNLDKEGYIKVDEGQGTNIEGAYAVGDVTTKSNMLQQAITASAEGAVAAKSVYEYLKRRVSK